METATISPDAQEINARVLVAFFGWRWYMHNTEIPSPRPDKKEEAFLLPADQVSSNVIKIEAEPQESFIRVYGQNRCPMPDFCNDANLLPRLLDEVEKRGMCWTYADALKMLGCIEEKSASPPKVWQAERSPLRLKVIAALQACMEWPGIWCTDGE
jgi:hypothetical protein